MFSGISEAWLHAVTSRATGTDPNVVAFRGRRSPSNAATSPLLTDLYQINMIQSYLDHGDTETADLRGSRFPGEVHAIPERRGIFLCLHGHLPRTRSAAPPMITRKPTLLESALRRQRDNHE
jgi:hypothetical protein